MHLRPLGGANFLDKYLLQIPHAFPRQAPVHGRLADVLVFHHQLWRLGDGPRVVHRARTAIPIGMLVHFLILSKTPSARCATAPTPHTPAAGVRHAGQSHRRVVEEPDEHAAEFGPRGVDARVGPLAVRLEQKSCCRQQIEIHVILSLLPLLVLLPTKRDLPSDGIEINSVPLVLVFLLLPIRLCFLRS